MKKGFSPDEGAIVDTHTELQDEFIDRIHAHGTTAALEWLLPYKTEVELCLPKRLCFSWPEDGSESYLLELAESADFHDAQAIRTEGTTAELTNLKIGQDYFWRINGSDTRTFTTADSKYRFIKVGGLLNVRDVGGINIKQGLIYRGADLQNGYEITEEGKRVFTEELKIKTELNLRRDTDFPYPHSPAGESVRYVRLVYRPYREIFEDEHRRGIVDIMNFLADEDNYPTYIHCLGGADRTGMIALYLRAIAGESDEDMLTDYELTSLSTYALGLTEGVADTGFRNRNSEYFTTFLDMLSEYNGNTLGERLISFLLDCGVGQKTLDKIRSIIKK